MHPILIFFLSILLLPTLELFILVQVGSSIGVFATVLLVLSTAVLGTLLVRHQGLSTLLRVRQAMARGEVPALEMLDGALLLVGGLLLLIPGFLTDLMGLVCLLPWVRRRLVARLVGRFQVSGEPGDDLGQGRTPFAGMSQTVIEGEYRRERD